ncbi:activated Cdc42 kinase-like isoform X2 [Planococcus citri]|uniref:activated Cdc42 kinase-like isoform X2 n=1 Tax=Planococcus citri TaxID=170843 RepID=UPI0031F78481
MSHTKGPGLYEFLIEAELQQYYSGLKNDLKVQNVAHLKYVAEQDLDQLGMTKPEIRRLKKFYLKHFPQNYFAKFKKMILSKEEKDSWDLMIPEDNGLDSKPPVRVPNKHIIPADSILVNKELGTGEFGVVQQGVWTNEGERIQVAIKCLSRERMQSNPIEFLKEAAIMHSIDHEHIVRLYGVVLDTNALMLVTELAPLRSLLECLKEPSLRSSFPVLTLCDFSIQICDGMQYLETKRLIHRDLAARNILVFSKNKVKISDFGLSRALGVGKDYYQTNFNVNLKLPIAWCAPECISYLRFTSASDVWAYGVTLWEMFSYGFQPWAALTGHQILEAIDEPNFQRLEHPECCPKEYYSLMLKCWQHDPNKRPRFSDLMTLLPECKPEQVQAIQDSVDERMKRDQLPYRVGDVITVLNKSPVASIPNCWKGVLNNGKSGLFNPAHTVAYIGSNLPSNKPGEFVRGESKIYASRRSKLRPEMISRPQGELKHTGHVGLDGAYFGDISFLGSGTKYNHLPHQIVTPYKPQDDCTNSTEPSTPSKIFSDRAPLLSPEKGKSTHSSNIWLDYESIRAPCNSASKCGKLTDHEYHEIGNEELNAESPRFEKTFDFGPSLLDEMDAMFKTLGSEKNNSMVAGVSNYASSPPPSPLDADINKRNELREIAASVAATMHKGKKKQAMVKPISAADEKTLDSAIAMANELAARSLNDLDSKSHQLPDSPVTPVSPNKRKFSFRFPTPVTGHSSSRPEGKTFSDEAASIPDIQSFRSSLASLPSCCSVESLKESTPFRIPPWDRPSTEFCFARSHAILTKHHPTLYSVNEHDRLNGNVVEDTCSRSSLAGESSSLPRPSIRGHYSTLHRYVKQNLDAVSNLSNSVDLACDSEPEFSRVSEISKEGMSVSSYDWVFRSPKCPSNASSETLIDENSSLSDKDMVLATKPFTSSASFPNSPRKCAKRVRSSKSIPMRRIEYQCSSSESEYETAHCRTSSYNSGSSRGSTSKYTMPRGSSSSDDDFAQIMKAFMK